MRALSFVDVSSGNADSEQAEVSQGAPLAAKTEMRILIELQVISYLLHNLNSGAEDLVQIRKDVAGSIT